ncbi:hypothetical protein COU37_00565 [Candidatus Micrarchaeota archaeon CG10_big_fil_rev_8_21_14_0_10_45_29]|nr:MAG: hypothetical protein COU37_00565 [Candidatus Micrarchaeota archaeon CG10_big_fil_rev_8_21_14_0_10_45_29]
MQEIYLVIEKEFNIITPLWAYLKKEDALAECERLAKEKYAQKIEISQSIKDNYEVGEYSDFEKNEGFALFSMVGKKRNKAEIYFCAMKIKLQ